MRAKLPAYFVSHGGGPWPWMGEQAMYAPLKQSLEDIPRQIGRLPRAILVISAHWEAAPLALSAQARPGMLYDYGGFPAHTYQIQYPAPGAPELAIQVQQMLTRAGFPAQLDFERGYDHGTFVPLACMYPQATVPILQMSLQRGLDPALHIAIGQALAPLRMEDVLLVGSGLSYHNLRMFNARAAQPSREFDQWLLHSMNAAPEQRLQALRNWQQAPAARIAHPREEHLLPLMVIAGAGGDDPAYRFYHEDDLLGGISVSSYRFGAVPGA